ncbi:MAG: ABC transporter permease [Rhodothermales bacterium]
MPTATLSARPAILPSLIDHLVWIILAGVLVVCSLTIENFFQTGIFVNIARQATFVGILSAGLALVIIAGHMDLSIESVMAFSAMLAAYLVGSNGAGLGLAIPVWATLLLSLAVGAGVGLLNGWLVIRLKINAFIVTLATFITVRGLALVLAGGRSVFGLPDAFRGVANAELLGIPVLVLILAAVYGVLHVVLTRMRFGRYLYMIGGNATAPFRAGIAVDRILWQAFVLSGVLAALAGWLLASRTNGATANLGTGMLFEAFAAVVIGGVSLTGGVGRLSGVIAGVLLLSTIDTAINVMGLPPHYMQVIRGGLVLLAVLFDSAKTSLRRLAE